MTTVEEILKSQRLHKTFKERAREEAAKKKQEREAEISEDGNQLQLDVAIWLERLDLTADEVVNLSFKREQWGNHRALLTWKIEGVSFRAYHDYYPDGEVELVVQVEPSTGAYHQVHSMADIGALL